MRFHSTVNEHTFPAPTSMKLKVLDGIQAAFTFNRNSNGLLITGWISKL